MFVRHGDRFSRALNLYISGSNLRSVLSVIFWHSLCSIKRILHRTRAQESCSNNDRKALTKHFFGKKERICMPSQMLRKKAHFQDTSVLI